MYVKINFGKHPFSEREAFGMVIAISDHREEEIRKLISQVAEICLSEEFADLRKELESVYFMNSIENALLTAFQDALYAILTQREGVRGGRTQVY